MLGGKKATRKCGCHIIKILYLGFHIICNWDFITFVSIMIVHVEVVPVPVLYFVLVIVLTYVFCIHWNLFEKTGSDLSGMRFN